MRDVSEEKVYLVKMYYEEEKFKTRMQEYIFKCSEEDIEKFTKNEIEVFEKAHKDIRVTDVMIFVKYKDYK